MAETPPVFELDTDAPFNEALPLVLRYLTLNETLTSRLVCKDWNRVVVKLEKSRKQILLKVSNSHPASIDVFRKLRRDSPVTGFRFLDCDVGRLLEDPAAFNRFSINQCPELRCLIFQNSKICTGRFYEVLAFCKNLKKLEIRESPSIFENDNGIGLYFWAFTFKYVAQNLANVEQFVVTGNDLNARDICSLTKAMKGLKCLLIMNNQKPLPIEGINKSLENVSNTLTTLSLIGQIPESGFGRDDIEMVNLEALNLQKSRLPEEASEKLGKFLKNCPNLKILRLSQCNLQKCSFVGILGKLRCLELKACILPDSAFRRASLANLVELSLAPYFQTNETSEATGTEKALRMLLGINKPKLLTLQLDLAENGGKYLPTLDPRKQRKLKELVLTASNGIAGQPLRRLLNRFKSLRKLSIEQSSEIRDECLLPEAEDGQGALTHMKDLEYLSLSETHVTNKIIRNTILPLEKLKYVNFSKTNVNICGLEELAESYFCGRMPALREVVMEDLVLSKSRWLQFQHDVPEVQIKCMVVADDAPEVEALTHFEDYMD